MKKYDAYEEKYEFDDDVPMYVLAVKYDSGWDVFYAKQGYGYTLAYGLPKLHTVEEVFQIAEANIPFYKDLFEE